MQRQKTRLGLSLYLDCLFHLTVTKRAEPNLLSIGTKIKLAHNFRVHLLHTKTFSIYNINIGILSGAINIV